MNAQITTARRDLSYRWWWVVLLLVGACVANIAPARGQGYQQLSLLSSDAPEVWRVSQAGERGYTLARAGDFVTLRVQAMPEMILDLFNTIETIAKYPAPQRFPSVRQVSRGELEREACAGQRCRFVRAAYLPEKGLFLENSLDPQSSVMDRSILLHELVHHVQALSQRYAHLNDCERRREEEREAYAIQNAYLARVGAGRQIVFPERGYRCEATQS